MTEQQAIFTCLAHTDKSLRGWWIHAERTGFKCDECEELARWCLVPLEAPVIDEPYPA